MMLCRSLHQSQAPCKTRPPIGQGARCTVGLPGPSEVASALDAQNVFNPLIVVYDF